MLRTKIRLDVFHFSYDFNNVYSKYISVKLAITKDAARNKRMQKGQYIDIITILIKLFKKFIASKIYNYSHTSFAGTTLNARNAR